MDIEAATNWDNTKRRNSETDHDVRMPFCNRIAYQLEISLHAPWRRCRPIKTTRSLDACKMGCLRQLQVLFVREKWMTRNYLYGILFPFFLFFLHPTFAGVDVFGVQRYQPTEIITTNLISPVVLCKHWTWSLKLRTKRHRGCLRTGCLWEYFEYEREDATKRWESCRNVELRSLICTLQQTTCY
jgi:hypothetical protein